MWGTGAGAKREVAVEDAAAGKAPETAFNIPDDSARIPIALAMTEAVASLTTELTPS